MAVAEIKVEFREKAKHQPSAVLRRAGRVPGVFYARNEDTVHISLDALDLQRLLHTETNIVSIHFPDGKVRQSILRDIQLDPVTDKAIHVDFMGIKMTEKVRLSIPVVLKGSPAGVKEGGILEHLIREVEVEGLPLDIPDHLEVDVSALNIGDVMLLEQISVEKIRFVTDLKHPVANVVQPKVVKEPVVVPGELVEGEEGEKAAEEGAAEEGKDKDRDKDRDKERTRDKKGTG